MEKSYEVVKPVHYPELSEIDRLAAWAEYNTQHGLDDWGNPLPCPSQGTPTPPPGTKTPSPDDLEGVYTEEGRALLEFLSGVLVGFLMATILFW